MTKLLFVAALLSTVAVSSFAQSAPATAATPATTAFAQSHPRRAEVNHRLATQHRRIDAKVAESGMGAAKAVRLHKQDRQIRREERLMASQDGGHITKGEQRVLNHQENKVSRQIGN